MKSISISLLLVCTLNVQAQTTSIKDLTGRWETTDGAGLEIIDSARIFLTYGKERKPILSYRADFSKSPCWFDFVVKDSAQKLLTMKSLLLPEGDVLKWQVFEEGERPADFAANRGDVVILRKKK
jgi:hypothetical protein